VSEREGESGREWKRARERASGESVSPARRKIREHRGWLWPGERIGRPRPLRRAPSPTPRRAPAATPRAPGPTPRASPGCGALETRRACASLQFQRMMPNKPLNKPCSCSTVGWRLRLCKQRSCMYGTWQSTQEMVATTQTHDMVCFSRSCHTVLPARVLCGLVSPHNRWVLSRCLGSSSKFEACSRHTKCYLHKLRAE